MKKSLSIGRKLSFIVIIMVVVGMATVGIVSYSMYRRDSIAVSADKARSIAETFAASIDGDQYVAILSSEEKTDYWYEKKAAANDAIKRTNVAYLYLLGKDYDTHVEYFLEGIADDADEEDACDLGEREEVSVHADEVFETLRSGKSSYTEIYDAGEYGMMLSGFAPIFSSNGAVAGIVGVDINVDDVMASSDRFGLFIIISIVAFSALFGLLSYVYISKSVGKPIATLSAASKKMAKGDMDVSLTVKSGDEIGQLTVSFLEMIESTNKQIDIMEALARGDLTLEIVPRSERDSMSRAMNQTFANLTKMFGEIQSSAAQVKAGSESIAGGAQMLAQGASEQAAAVENLSGNINDVSRKTDESARMAAQAAELVNEIMRTAETGNHQMDDMIAAVNEINRAGQEINRVIKVIDDIAFQTNILALNAAVEAAHAGQSGKGFAVVAEEVRSLAAKSAEAAKDTSALIADSVEKAEFGSRIASDTAESLAKIVAGIRESDTLVNNIAKSSDEQSNAIKLINQGIDQISDVVRQTSATAEESAAASEEMSGQSTVLEGLISYFSLTKKTNLPSHDATRNFRY